MTHKLIGSVALVLCLLGTSASSQGPDKLDSLTRVAAAAATGRSAVIVRGRTGATLDALIVQLGGTLGRSLPRISARAATIPNGAIGALASSAVVDRISFDRRIDGSMERTGAATGALPVRQQFGLDGAGVGVAVIDSGVAPHDDLSPMAPRIARFVDFVNGSTAVRDDYGHGTHVAGIVAGNGADSNGARTGIAPGASLTVLRVLDANGTGRISDVIAALGYVVDHQSELNLRIVNVSLGASVSESYATDPLALATRNAVEHGIVVVASAGNLGRRSDGAAQYGGITAPGNAPWVLTVGASSHNGTIDRADDVIASFSSRGPTHIDRAAKPDLIAPGVGIESLSVSGSTLYTTRGNALLPGTVVSPPLPYLSLSGTSMSAPVVAGVVALMIQANPSLTPNAVKAILEYTAENRGQYDWLTQGAGYLDAYSAVALSRYFANPSVGYPSSASWSAQVIWGNRRIVQSLPPPGSRIWATDATWGSDASPDTGMAWWTGVLQNVVWGLKCGGFDCQNHVWSTSDGGDTVVWGTDGGDTVVWGTSDGGDTVVWGTGAQDNVVWQPGR